MRIAFVAGEYPPLQGGLGDFTRELGKALIVAGHEAHVITRVVPGAPGREAPDGQPEVHRLIPAWGWDSRRRIDGFLRTFKPDVVNLQYQAAAYGMHPAINLLPGRLAKKVPTVVTFHDLRAPYLFPKAGSLRRRSILIMARGARAAIVTNVEDAQSLLDERVPNVHSIPIGSNISPETPRDFSAERWKAAHGIPGGTALFGYFGFLNESKGGESLIRALADLRRRGLDVGLLHIGGKTGASDPTNLAYAQHLDALAVGLNVRDRVYETGFLDNAGVSAAFAACECVALPYRDGASFRRGTLMAAFAHGAAIVTTEPRVRLTELRDGDAALLVPPDQPQRLADAIARVLADPGLRARLQAGSAAVSGLFRWDHIARQTLAVFVEVTKP